MSIALQFRLHPMARDVQTSSEFTETQRAAYAISHMDKLLCGKSSRLLQEQQ